MEIKQTAGSLGILLLLFFLLPVLEPRFLSSYNLINILRIASISVLAVYGQTIVLITGKIDLSMGSVAGFVSVIVGLSLQQFGLATSFILGLLTGMIAGFINGILIFRFRLSAFIITFGMLTSMGGLANFLTGSAPIELITVKGFGIPGSGYLGPVPIPLIIAVISFFILRVILVYTAFGRTIYAIGSNEKVAWLSGRRVELTGIGAYILSGLLVAIAAIIMSSRIYSGQPNLAPALPFDAIAASAVGGVSMRGGKGNLLQATIGALIVTVFLNGLNLLNVSTYLQMVTRGVLILLAVIINNIRAMGIFKPLVTATVVSSGSKERRV